MKPYRWYMAIATVNQSLNVITNNWNGYEHMYLLQGGTEMITEGLHGLYKFCPQHMLKGFNSSHSFLWLNMKKNIILSTKVFLNEIFKKLRRHN